MPGSLRRVAGERLKPVATLPTQLHLVMDPDERLAAAAGGVVRCMGDTAGLASEATLQLQAAVLAACRKCFGTQTTGKRCEIRLRRSEDRIEVEVTVPECTPPEHEKLAWPGVDEVICEERSGAGVLRLTKFVAAAAKAE
jgi:hypothetical protein